MPGPSDPQPILVSLRERMIAARTRPDPETVSYIYPLNSAVLPSTGDGDPGAVLASLTAALIPVVGGPLTITSAADPVLTTTPPESPVTLTLTGTSAVLTGDPATAVTVVFTVSDGLALQATWTAAQPDGWSLADVFEVLDVGGFGLLPLNSAVFIATTYTHTDPAVFFPLQPGLQYQGTLPVRTDLLPATGDSGETGVQHVTVGGPLNVSPDGRPQFAWTGAAALGSLTISRVGQAALTLTGGTVTLSSTRTDDLDANVDQLTITGRVLLGATAVKCTLDLPTTTLDRLTLRAVDPSVTTLPSASAALAASGTQDAFTGLLPATLLDLAGVSLTGYSLVFAPGGGQTTATTITLGFGSTEWPLVPSLRMSVSRFVLEATVSRTPGYRATPEVTVRAEIRGMLSLGETWYAVRAGMPPTGAWYVEITDTGKVPTLANLAELAGLTEDRVTAVLPGSLLALGSSFTLSRVALLADPASQQLSEIAFRIGQTRPWSLAAGLLTVSDWAVDLVLAKGASGWTTSGVLSGKVGLTAGGSTTTLNVHLPVPIGDDTLWTLALDEDTPVHLPTIGQILSLLGVAPAALPTGLTSLGGLDVTRFTVSFDPAAATLEHVAFVAAQTGKWTIISDALAVTGMSASLSFLPGTTPVGVSGYIEGTLVLAGTPVDVVMLKNDYDGGWLLQAAYQDFVHVPGFSALDAWLSPDTARGKLPDTLPLASGFEVGDVFLAFAGDATGVLQRIGFTIRCADLWTVVPGHLSLTDVEAVLALEHPVTAAGVTGTVSGVLTIAGVDIGGAVTKPATEDHWEFNGRLLTGLTIDLVAAANALTDAAGLALPADATTRGLPASITIESAEVRAVPDTGLFHFSGSVAFDWTFAFGAASLAVRSIGGTIDILRTGAPLSAMLTGTFDFAGIHVILALVIGGAAQQAVLTGTLKPEDAQNIQISGLTDGVAASSEAEKWASVVPTDLVGLRFGGAAMYLNLTRSQFLLYGALNYGAGLSADAMVYLAPDTADPTAWTYAVALALGPNFRFGSLVPALSVIDEHLHVTQARLIVCNLRSGTLGGLAQTTTTLFGEVAPTAPAPLAGLTTQVQSLSTGAYLVARIDFSTGLFSRFLQIGTATNPPSVSVFALLDHADSTQTVFGADLPDITILDTITLTHTDAHPGIHLSYTPALAGRFDLVGRIALTGVFGSGYQFDVTLTVDDTGLTSTVEQTSQTIDNPFGLPGIVLSDLALMVAYTWAVPARNGNPARPRTSSFTLAGHVLLGPAPQQGLPDQRLSCDARIALRSGVPVLVYVSLASDLSIGDFLAQCLTGSGANWSAGFVDVTFTSGSFLYYYSQADDPGGALATLNGHPLRDGFNVDAVIRLTLVTEITLHGVVSVLRDPTTHAYLGVRAGIRLDHPIDLVFVTLADSTPPAAGQPYTGGPLLAFETGTSPTFVLSAGINFLGSAFLAADVTVGRGPDGGTVFTGQLTAARPLTPFGVLSCGFSYTTHPGLAAEFHLQDWPDFTWASEIVDVVQAIKSLADTGDGSVCGHLADLVVNSAYHSSFSISPSASVSGDDLVFTLTGTYALTITSTDASNPLSPFLTATMPDCSVHIPKTTRWESLPDALKEGIAGASARFAQDLLNRPAQLALLLAMVVGPKAASVALELACNNLSEGAVAAASEAAADAIAAAGGVLAAGAAAAGAAAAAASLAQSGDGGGQSGQIGTPNFKRVVYANGMITGTWDGARNAAGYTFEVLRPDGTSLVRQDFGLVLTGDLPVDAPALPAGTYRGQVRGRRGSQTGTWSTSLPIVKPAAPAVTLTYTGTSLVAGWAEAGADGYTARFIDPAGNQIGTDVPLARNVLQATLPLPDPVAGTYSAQVQARRDQQIPGVWATPTTLRVVTLTAPAITGVTRADGVLNVTWTPGAQTGPAYDVQVRDGATVIAATSVSVAGADLSPSGLAPGTTYAVMVRAHGDGVVSPWSRRDFTVLEVPAPAPVGLIDDSGDLVASWAPVTAATYHLRLLDLDAAGGPVGTLDGVTTTSATVTRTDGQRPAEGSRYQVQARAEIGGNLGPWAFSPELNVVTLAAPADITLTAVARTLSLAWSAPPLPATLTGPFGYQVLLSPSLPTKSAVGRIDGIAGTTVSPTRDDGRALTPGEVYAARVRARLPRHVGPWGASATVTIMDAVEITSAGYEPNVVRVAWTPSTIAGSSYEVNLTPSTGGPGLTVPISGQVGAPAPTQVGISLTGQPTGVVYAVRVRAVSPGSKGDWSAPVTVVAARPPGGLALGYDGTQVTAVWEQATGATGYRFTLTDSAGAVAATQDTAGPVTSGALPAAGLTRSEAYHATVATLIGTVATPPSASVPVTLIDPPAGITASLTAIGVQVSWQPVNRAVKYTVAILDLDGRQFATVETATTSVTYDGREIVAGVGYQVKVAGAADVAGPYSAAVRADQSDFTCLCLGVTPSRDCGNGGIEAAFTGVFRHVSRKDLDAGFQPTRTPDRTGWVAIPPGRTGSVAVLAQLVGLLAMRRVLTDEEAFAVFTKSRPVQVRSLSGGGDLTCLCLGTSPGQACGNGDTTSEFTGVFTRVTPAEADRDFHPTKRTPVRSGWVAVGAESHIPGEVLLQLVNMLARKRTLIRDEPYDIFNNTTTTAVRQGTGGPTTCVALGVPVGQGCRTVEGTFGDLVIDVPEEEVTRSFAPGLENGWTTIDQDDHSVLSATIQLVTLLFDKGILVGDEPFDVFNEARAAEVH